MTLELMLRLRDVEVDGVPLDVGDNCRTSKPFALTLEGHMTLKDGVQVGYTLATGGELTGSVTLPPSAGAVPTRTWTTSSPRPCPGCPVTSNRCRERPARRLNGADPTFCMPDFTPRDVPEAAR